MLYYPRLYSKGISIEKYISNLINLFFIEVYLSSRVKGNDLRGQEKKVKSRQEGKTDRKRESVSGDNRI